MNDPIPILREYLARHSMEEFIEWIESNLRANFKTISYALEKTQKELKELSIQVETILDFIKETLISGGMH